MNNLFNDENTLGMMNGEDFVEQDDMFSDQDDVFVDTTVSPPYPGTPLRVGSAGTNVSIMQSYLNAIRLQMFPSMNRLTVDGVYGQETRTTVSQYQRLSGLCVDGVIGEETWNSIVTDYNSLPTQPGDEYPGTVLRPGSTGTAVRNMQTRLNRIVPVYTAINYQTVDGIYGNSMTNAVRRFQGQFGLTVDGLIGQQTWDKIVSVHTGVMNNNNTNVTSAYPGYVQTTGSRGDSVRFIQSYMNSVNSYNSHNWPVLAIDGIYGPQTRQVVLAFQNRYNLAADGMVGPNTWRRMITEFNNSI
ncbi:MAG: peptidoglycan-binding protein [Oscillospiraceae bacterium]|nr:peptidoglycan-binding protein [Oscillospiraceae bacterium]